MPTYPFLSDSWIAECRKLREEYRGKVRPPAGPPIRMNLVITGAPHGTPSVDAHFDTSSGEPELDLGHLAGAEVKVTADYDTARAVFVDGNLAAAMEGLQLGRIKVDGDMMKLMSLASVQADPGSLELARAIREITE